MAKRKRHSSTIEEILHGLIIRNEDFSMAQLAEALGVREYVLYEQGNPNNDRQFPLSMLIPLTKATGNTALIEHLAASVGLVATKIRKRGKCGIEHVEDLQESLESFSELLRNLTVAFRDKTKVDRRALLAAIDKFLGTLVGLRQDVENLSDQYELGLEE